MKQPATHLSHRSGWLRAAVLGANDGIVSTASLILGVAAAGVGTEAMLVAGIAGAVAGAMSMAAGEYVSVSSQADTQRADLALERREHAEDPDYEHAELTAIYVRRGLEPELADEVAGQLMRHDALGAHSRDEIGISTTLTARPMQAALASASTFATGAALPLLMVLIWPREWLIPALAVSVLLFLGLLGYLSAKAGGAPPARAVVRVMFWGGLAMAVTTAVGSLFDVAV